MSSAWISREMDAIERRWAAIERAGQGNPNHDPHTGQFTGGGGSVGKHAARHRRRHRKARRILAGHRKDMAELRARHKADRRETIRDQREDHRQLRRDQRAERKELKRDQIGERKELRQEQAAEIRDFHRDRARELRQIDRDEAKALRHAEPGEHEAIRAEHTESRRSVEEEHAGNLEYAAEQHPIARAELRATHKEARADQRYQHREDRKDKKREHREERAEIRQSQRDERKELIDQTIGELAEHGFRRKGAARGLATDGATAERLVLPPSGVQRRISAGRTHKASSAESILRHCLRTLGFTAAYRRGELDARQRIDLLDAVREYGRDWMRHEVESFFAHHATERALGGAMGRHVGRLFDRLKGFVRELIHSAVSALLGPDLTDDEAAEADRLADLQDGFLDRFRADLSERSPREIADPLGLSVGSPITPAMAAARAEMYGNAAWQAAQQVERITLLRTKGAPPRISGKGRMTGSPRWERRILGKPKTEHCTDCPPLAAQGWVPVGTLPPIGATECGHMCLCHFEYSDAVEMPAGKVKSPPRIEIEVPELEHPEGPLTKEQLDEIMGRIKFSAKVVVGS